MLYQINSEYYKNLKYQEFDITYKLESSSISACLLEPDLSRTNDKNSIFESIKMIGQYINYRTEAFETRNQYILSINIDIIDNKKSEYFNDTISCIFQSKITGNILVSFDNGNIYLYTRPNIDFNINNEK